MMDDTQLTAVGLTLCLLGVVLLFVPFGVDGLSAFVATLILVVVVGIGLLVAIESLTTATDQSVPLPSPERRPQYRQPGTDFAETLDSVDLVGHRAQTEDIEAVDQDTFPRDRLRARLHEVAVDVLSRTTGRSHEDATEQLVDGSWTKDSVAAAFFRDSLAPDLSWRHRVPLVSAPPLPTVRRAQHAVAALAEHGTDERMQSTRRTTPSSAETDYWPTDSLPATQSTGRRRQLLVAVLTLSGIGVLFGYPGAVLVATVGISLTAAARFSSPTVSLMLSRELDETDPAPGDEVTVTVTIHNEGEQTLTDLRLFDGVPAGLHVVEDSPRFSTALRPGKTATFSYTVRAVEGRHTFEPAIAVVSDLLGATEQVDAVHASAQPSQISCGFDEQGDATGIVRPQVTRQAGAIEGNTSGAGLEFDSVREYRRGDPPSRIDWHHHAKTGTLSTVDFREPRQPNVVLVVDTRQTAYVSATDTSIPAPRHSASAAARISTSLLANVVPVGLATIGTDCWVPPTCGGGQDLRLRHRLAGAQAAPWTPPSESTAIDDAVGALKTRVAPSTQLVVLSPLTDDESVAFCRRLAAAGHEMTVLSPDCTGSSSVEGAYAGIERRRRCSELRSVGVRVYDWTPETPLEEVFTRGTDR